MIRPPARSRLDDDGFTLVELIVAMTILVIFFAVFSNIATRVFSTTRRQQDRSASVDVSRNITEKLDRQVRYANAINTPGVTSDGTQWVEWRSGSLNRQQTCYQWRVTPAGLAQYRSWNPAYGGAATTASTVWTTAGYGAGRRGTDPVFSVAGNGSAAQFRQQLTLSFQAGKDAGRDGAATRISFTALNSSSPSAPFPAVCQEYPRS